MRAIVCLLLVLIISGCKTELYSELSEQEANEMLAVLSDKGISSQKIAGKDKTYTLSVQSDKFSEAVLLLKENGYPREDFSSMGEIFVKDSMISSSVEEKARYNYALTQELSATLAQIDGVLRARVHVVIPEADAYGKKTSKPSASVFIKHVAAMPVDSLVPKVKSLVANSIEGLGYADVSVTLFPALYSHQAKLVYIQESSILASLTSGLTPWLALIALVVLVIVALIYAFFNRNNLRARLLGGVRQ